MTRRNAEGRKASARPDEDFGLQIVLIFFALPKQLSVCDGGIAKKMYTVYK